MAKEKTIDIKIDFMGCSKAKTSCSIGISGDLEDIEFATMQEHLIGCALNVNLVPTGDDYATAHLHIKPVGGTAKFGRASVGKENFSGRLSFDGMTDDEYDELSKLAYQRGRFKFSRKVEQAKAS